MNGMCKAIETAVHAGDVSNAIRMVNDLCDQLAVAEQRHSAAAEYAADLSRQLADMKATMLFIRRFLDTAIGDET